MRDFQSKPPAHAPFLSPLARAWAAYVMAGDPAGVDEDSPALCELANCLNDAPVALRAEWIESYLRRRFENRQFHLPLTPGLVTRVVFPELARRRVVGDAWAVTMLDRLYRSSHRNVPFSTLPCWATIGNPTPCELLREGVALGGPDAESCRARLVEELIEFIGYTLHELPLGVLFGHDGAKLDECVHLQETLEEVERLATPDERTSNGDLLRQARYHYWRYAEYLRAIETGGSPGYEAFCSRSSPE